MMIGETGRKRERRKGMEEWKVELCPISETKSWLRLCPQFTVEYF